MSLAALQAALARFYQWLDDQPIFPVVPDDAEPAGDIACDE